MKKLMFTLALLSAFSGQAQAELTWKKMQAGASSGGSYSVTEIPEIIGEKVYTAGENNVYGQLGHATNLGLNVRTPITEATSLWGALKCQASPYISSNTICFMPNGDIVTFGDRGIGRDTTAGNRYQILPVPEWKNAKSCSTSSISTICIMPDGKVLASGISSYGKLNKSLGDYEAPFIIPEYEGAKQCSAGHYHSVCVMNDGSVKGAGFNGAGELGGAFPVHASNSNFPPKTIPNLTDVKECVAGYNAYTICVMNNGTVKFFGNNSNGRFGNGTTASTATPTEVNWGGEVKECMSGYPANTICLMADGTVKGAGSNAAGQLGNGTTTQQLSPITITGFQNAKKCSMGDSYTLCNMPDNSVKVTGGYLGTSYLTPTVIPALNGAKECSAGYQHLICTGVSGTLLPPCNSSTEYLGKTADGTKYICKNNKWVVL